MIGFVSFAQIEGLNYLETCYPMMKMETIFLIIVLSSINYWQLQQLDGNIVFLQMDLIEDVYMIIPLRLHSYDSSKCSK